LLGGAKDWKGGGEEISGLNSSREEWSSSLYSLYNFGWYSWMNKGNNYSYILRLSSIKEKFSDLTS